MITNKKNKHTVTIPIIDGKKPPTIIIRNPIVRQTFKATETL